MSENPRSSAMMIKKFGFLGVDEAGMIEDGNQEKKKKKNKSEEIIGWDDRTPSVDLPRDVV